MHPARLIPLLGLLVAGCGAKVAAPPATSAQAPGKPAASSAPTLVEARKQFQTKLPGKPAEPGDALPEPPAKLFKKVAYPAAVGELAAYVTPNPKDGNKHPAIVWITGGDCNSIGEVWEPAPADNDQTAAAYRKAGVVMMFPSLRGGNQNPGRKESFLGEVDDVVAAADFLAKQDYVDPGRIYLGGHSTGGTLVLLVAECSQRFRAVFSFGPADDVAGYGTELVPIDMANKQEVKLRSPGYWLADVKTPTFVFEGGVQGNADSLRAMKAGSSNPNLHFYEVPGRTHFSVLAPTNALIAKKILADAGPSCDIAITPAELTPARRGR